MDDLISRSRLIEELEGFKLALGDIVLGWVVDRVIERVRQLPAATVNWSRPGPCPITVEQFVAIYNDDEDEEGTP